MKLKSLFVLSVLVILAAALFSRAVEKTENPQPVAVRTAASTSGGPTEVSVLNPMRAEPTRLLEDDKELDEDSSVESKASASDASTSGPTVGVFGPARGGAETVILPSQDESSGRAGSSPGIDVRAILEPLSDSQVQPPVFNPGVRVPTGGSASAPAEPEPETSAQAEIEDDSTLPWVKGQARGYTALYAMHPRARPVVEQHLRALIKSHVRQLYLGILVDGTFSKDYDYARSLVRRLSTNGRELTLVLYLSNGATQRQWKETTIDALFNKLDPVRFRGLIRSDRETRARFQQVAQEARQLFAFNRQDRPNNQNVAIVMLEDNLERGSYAAMRRLAQAELGDLVTFVRNPCVGCFRGNDGDTQGDSREEHALGLFSTLGRGDAYALDGEGFTYPGEQAGDKVSYAQTRDLMRQAYARELRYIGLWRHGWQGLTPGQPRDHPDERSYIPTTDAQLDFDIQLLREGLPPEDIPLVE